MPEYTMEDYIQGLLEAHRKLAASREAEHVNRATEITIWICWECGGYEPITKDEHGGDGLRGDCDICGRRVREVHRFTTMLDLSVLSDCECSSGHPRRTRS